MLKYSFFNKTKSFQIYSMKRLVQVQDNEILLGQSRTYNYKVHIENQI
jgi:hypothetical protein